MVHICWRNEEHFLNILCFLLLYEYIWDSEESRETTTERRREDLNVWRGFTLPFTSTPTSKPSSEWKAYLMPFVYLDFPNDRPFTPFVVVQSTLHVWFFAIPQTAACKASLSFTIFLILLKLMSIQSVMPSNHLILLPSILLNIRVFSNESALRISWPK